MKITVKKTSLLAVCIIIAILILDNYFGFGSLIGIDNSKVFLGVIIISFMICIYLLPNMFSLVLYKCKFINCYMVMVFVSYVILFVHSIFQYPMQGIKETLNAGISYLALFLVYPIYIFLIAEKNDKSIYRILDLLAIIRYILILIQYITYESGILIFPEEMIRTRNDRLRIGLHFYGNFMILYNFYKIYLTKEKSLFRLFLTLVGILELILIQQTRAYTLVVLICILIMILFQKNTKNKLLKKGVIVVLIATILFQTNIGSNFIQSLSSTGEEAGSTIGRQYSMAYYLSMFKSHFPLGLGFPNVDKYGQILNHKFQFYTTYIDDVGIIGQLGIWGLLIIPIFIVPMIRMIYVIVKLKKQKLYDVAKWYGIVFIYIIATSGTLMVLDSYRIMLFSIIIALIEFENFKIRENKI